MKTIQRFRLPAGSTLSLTLAAASLIAVPTAEAAPIDAWTTLSPGGMVDAGYVEPCRPEPVMLDAGGNSILVRVYGLRPAEAFVSIAKFDPDGVLLWRFDDRQAPRVHYAPDYNRCVAALDGDGNVLVSSSSVPLVYGAFGGVTIAKHSASDGTPLWVRTSNTLGVLAVGGVAADANGDAWLLARGIEGTLGAFRTLIAKYHGDTGAPVWLTPPNGEILVTPAYSAIAMHPGGSDAFVVSTRSAARISGATAEMMWTGDVPPTPNWATDLAGVKVDAGGDLFIARTELTDEIEIGNNILFPIHDYMTTRLSGATGAPQWTARPDSVSRYQGPALGDDVVAGIALDPSGQVIVHGRSQAGGLENRHYDFATLKLDRTTGDPLWTGLGGGAARYNGLGNDFDSGTSVGVDASGAVFVTGSTLDPEGNQDFLTRKYSGIDGSPLWNSLANSSALHDGEKHGHDAAQGLAVDADGDVRVTGREEAEHNDDQRLLRYDGDGGALLWSARSEPVVEREEALMAFRSRASTVDSSGNTVLAGTSFNGRCNEWLVMKVDASGDRLWSQRAVNSRTPFTPRCGEPFSVATDAAGDVFVTGFMGYDIATAKLAAADGSLLWSALPDSIATHESPFGSYAGASIAIDANGDVVVTAGQIPGNSNFAVVNTIKYDGSSGAFRWVGTHGDRPFYTAFGSQTAWPAGVFIDLAGDVIVVVGTDSNTAIIKYDRSSGEPAWTSLQQQAATFPCTGPAGALMDGHDPVVSCRVSPGDFATLRYDGETGETAWTHSPDGAVRFGGPGEDRPTDLAIAADGDIFVAGVAQGGDGEADWVLVRYSSDGSPRWSGNAARIDRPGFDLGFVRISLHDQGALILSGQAIDIHRNPVGPGAWSAHYAPTGDLLAQQSLPTDMLLHAAHLASDGDLRLTGTTQDGDAARAYVRRVGGIEVPVFRSGFEDGQ